MIICPKSDPPNMELMFQDHIYSFTPKAARALGKREGLVLVGHDEDLSGVGDFQLLVFAREGHGTGAATRATHDDYAIYLDGWRRSTPKYCLPRVISQAAY
jgi:hypothetical protein